VLTRLVEQIRELGAEGVGQSSWGPTLFVVQPNQTDAETLVQRLRSVSAGESLDIVIAPPANRGARIEVGST
jgi:predicted sugar kinase